jgi:hypothetical protein
VGELVKMRYVVMYQREARDKIPRSLEWHRRGPYRRRFVARLVCWWQCNIVQAGDDDCNGFLAIRDTPYVIEANALPPAKVRS